MLHREPSSPITRMRDAGRAWTRVTGEHGLGQPSERDKGEAMTRLDGRTAIITGVASGIGAPLPVP